MSFIWIFALCFLGVGLMFGLIYYVAEYVWWRLKRKTKDIITIAIFSTVVSLIAALPIWAIMNGVVK